MHDDPRPCPVCGAPVRPQMVPQGPRRASLGLMHRPIQLRPVYVCTEDHAAVDELAWLMSEAGDPAGQRVP